CTSSHTTSFVIQYTLFVALNFFQNCVQLKIVAFIFGSRSLIAFVFLLSASNLAFDINLYRSLADMSTHLFSHSRQYSISLQLTSSPYIISLLIVLFFARLSTLSFHLFLL